MASSGIWLDDDTYQQTAGQIWAQQQTQQLHAGEQWAQQALQQAIGPVQDALGKLQAMVPQVPTAAPTPAPTPAAPVAATPEPAPVTTPPPPTPETAPIPVGQTPTAEPTPTPPAATPAPAPTPPPAPEPQPIQVPTPAPTPSPVDAGENWAQQQIQNLLNPAQQAPQTPPSPAASPPAATGPSPSAGPPSAPTTSVPPGPQSSVPGDLIDQARQAATAAGIDPDIFTRQIQQESGFNPNAKSGAGALGIAQFMPDTAKGMGVDPMDPLQALAGAAKLDAQNLQKYGGDWGKALAAYNAGGGNVDKYGGIPPFAETQSYVKNILGGAQNLVQQGVQTAQNVVQQGQTAVNTAVQGVQSAVARTSQFGMGLSSGDAMAFCGPAAALAFAQTYGRNPTVDEAKQLAQQVGWNAGQGMAGPSSEVSLLKAMGVDAHMTSGVDWNTVAQDAQGGNPVIIDTPGHYYYVDGFNQDTGKFHVGTSGTDLKGGSEWMSSDQINAMPQSGGNARAAIFADHPLSGPGQAATQAQPSLSMGSNQPAVQNQAQNIGQAVLSVGGSNADTLLGLAPFGIGPGLQAGGTLISSLLNPQSAPGPLEQSLAQAVVGNGLQQPASDLTSGLLNAGTTAGQNLLTQGQNLINPLATTIAQAPSTPLGDVLTQNALVSQGIPTVQGALSAMPDLSAQGIVGAGMNLGTNIAPDVASAGGQVLANALGLPNAASQLMQTPQAQQIGSAINDFAYGGPIGAFNENLRGLGQDVLGGLTALPTPAALGQQLQNVSSTTNLPVLSGAAGVAGGLLQQPSVLDSMQTLQDLNDKYAGSAGSSSIPMAGQAPLTLGVDPSVMTPDDRAAYNQARMNVAGLTMGGVEPGDWLKGYIKGGVVSSPLTMADVGINSIASPLIHTVINTVGDVLHGPSAPGRLAGRALGTAQGITDWAGQFLGALSPSAARPTSLVGQTAGGPLPARIAAYGGEIWGMAHGAFQQATQNFITQQELGAAAGQAADKVGATGTSAWNAAYRAFMASPPADAITAAQAAGARVAGRADPGWLTGQLGKLAGGGAGGQNLMQAMLFPAYRMGMNWMQRIVEASPAGLAGTVIDAARGLVGQGPYAAGLLSQPATNTVAPLAQRLAVSAMGAALTVHFAQEALNGNINGSWKGYTPEEQDTLRASGAAPDTFRGPDGNWYSWDKAPPQLKGALIAAGAYADAAHTYAKALGTQQAAGPEAYGLEQPLAAAAGTLFQEVATQLVNATPLRTWANTYDTLTGGGGLSGATSLASNLAGELVPESGLLRGINQMTDPYQRQALQPKTSDQVLPAILQHIEQNLPGLSESLPARVDVLGRQVQNPMQGLGAVLRPAAGQPSALLDAMQAAGVAPSATPDAVPYGPGQIQLKPQEQRQWEKYRGDMLQQMAGPLVDSAQWQQMGQTAQGQKAQQLTLQRLNQQATAVADRLMVSDLNQSGNALQRVSLGASGRLSPVVGYGPSVLTNQSMLQQQLAQQALIQALLGGQGQNSQTASLIANA